MQNANRISMITESFTACAHIKDDNKQSKVDDRMAKALTNLKE